MKGSPLKHIFPYPIFAFPFHYTTFSWLQFNSYPLKYLKSFFYLQIVVWKEKGRKNWKNSGCSVETDRQWPEWLEHWCVSVEKILGDSLFILIPSTTTSPFCLACPTTFTFLHFVWAGILWREWHSGGFGTWHDRQQAWDSSGWQLVTQCLLWRFSLYLNHPSSLHPLILFLFSLACFLAWVGRTFFAFCIHFWDLHLPFVCAFLMCVLGILPFITHWLSTGPGAVNVLPRILGSLESTALISPHYGCVMTKLKMRIRIFPVLCAWLLCMPCGVPLYHHFFHLPPPFYTHRLYLLAFSSFARGFVLRLVAVITDPLPLSHSEASIFVVTYFKWPAHHLHACRCRALTLYATAAPFYCCHLIYTHCDVTVPFPVLVHVCVPTWNILKPHSSSLNNQF